MNVRKSSAPVSSYVRDLVTEDISRSKSSSRKNKKQLSASCFDVTVNHSTRVLASIRCHSFPESNASVESFEINSNDSSDSESLAYINDAMLKVRRLTHVYDEEEIIAKCDTTSLQATVRMYDDVDYHEPSKGVINEIPRTFAKLGDKSYKVPSKAAAILGANDLSMHHLLHDSAPKNSHALFLENKIKRTTASEFELIDGSNKVVKVKKKSGIGSEVKEKFASLWKQSELSTMSGYGSSSGGYGNNSILYGSSCAAGIQLKDMEKFLRAGKATVEQIKGWSHSFECLLYDKFGLAHFHDFLRSEFSDENIEFWIACEEYRTITNNKKLQSRAEKIYNDYVGVQAAREVNLDSKTRQQTEIDIHNPGPHTFDQAQKRIQALMEKDSYQRFLRSELYGKLLRASEEYHVSQMRTAKEPGVPGKNLTISNLGITAQDLSKLTMTTSKLVIVPHTHFMVTRGPGETDTRKTSIKMVKTPEREASLIGTVLPDDPSLPFSKQSLLFTADDKNK